MFNVPLQHNCHLQRATYGLKEAPQVWFECFTKFVWTTSQGRVLLLQWANNKNMIISGDDHGIQLVKLQRQFQLKNIGPVKYFLGLGLQRALGM